MVVVPLAKAATAATVGTRSGHWDMSTVTPRSGLGTMESSFFENKSEAPMSFRMSTRALSPCREFSRRPRTTTRSRPRAPAATR